MARQQKVTPRGAKTSSANTNHVQAASTTSSSIMKKTSSKSSSAKWSKERKTKAATRLQDPSIPPNDSCPILTLPVELKIEIYKRLLDLVKPYLEINTWDMEDQPRMIYAQRISAALCLASTCKAFREILSTVAQHTPVNILGPGCKWTDLPPHMTSLFLAHTQELRLSEIECQFELGNMTSLRQLEIEGANGKMPTTGTVQEESLDAVVPIIMGSKDASYVRDCLRDLDSCYTAPVAAEATRCPSIWKQAKELASRGVLVSKEIEVDLEVFVGDHCHNVGLTITFNIATKHVIRREAFVNDDDPVLDADEALEVLKAYSQHYDDYSMESDGFSFHSHPEDYEDWDSEWDFELGTYNGIPFEAVFGEHAEPSHESTILADR